MFSDVSYGIPTSLGRAYVMTAQYCTFSQARPTRAWCPSVCACVWSIYLSSLHCYLTDLSLARAAVIVALPLCWLSQPTCRPASAWHLDRSFVPCSCKPTLPINVHSSTSPIQKLDGQKLLCNSIRTFHRLL